MTIELVFETHSTTDDNERGFATGWLPGVLSLYAASPTMMSSGAETVRSFVKLAARFENACKQAPTPQSIAYFRRVFALARPGRPTVTGSRPMSVPCAVSQLMTESAVNVN